VERVLNGVQPSSIVIGTVPLPRRPIREVDIIKSRSDVLVLHVTRSNRDRLTAALITAILEDSKKASLREVLQPYVATTSYELRDSQQQHNNDTKNAKAQMVLTLPKIQPCGPLISNTIEPRILLMGETASPQPDQVGMEYAERSMWSVLSMIVGLSVSNKDFDSYQTLKEATLSRGIAIWDVLSNVIHDTARRNRKSKKKIGEEKPNRLMTFVEKYPSTLAFCFIGVKARKTFGKHFGVSDTDSKLTISSSRSSIRLIVLPSSSKSNKLLLEEKAAKWGNVMEEFFLD